MNKEVFLKNRERFFLALADGTRLRILNLLVEGEVCVCFFTETLGESQPKVSRHLAYLRGAGLVSTQRDGKWIYYRINWPEDTDLKEILRSTIAGLTSIPSMLAERKRLREVSGSGLVNIERGRQKDSEAVREKIARTASDNAQQSEDAIDTFLL